MSVVEYVEKYGSLSDGEHLKDVEVSLAGTFFMEYLLRNLFALLPPSVIYMILCNANEKALPDVRENY